MPLPSLSPATPVKESSPEVQEGSSPEVQEGSSPEGSSPEVQEGSLAAAETEGALCPANQGSPSASTMAPPAGKEGQSTSGDVETQKCLEAESPKEVKEKAEVESDQEENLIPLSQLTPYISCYICKGYLIDAATITECLHSFCKSCIIKHFEHSNTCPKCNTVVHEAKPHNSLRLDPQLQNIVYKLVAGLEEKEQKQRREFAKGNCPETPKPAAVLQPGPSSEGSTKDLVE
uniref:polycomb group RING finger protein 6-like n=1 Tax=Myodes glareolus TaxID=447135 RepID=UPI0020203130|nr:polycomb group RING finger protein 6-like [Myodes glareolus]